MWQPGAFVLTILLVSCAPGSGPDLVVAVVGRSVNTFNVEVVNRSSVDMLLISPTRPNRQLDPERCTLLLSTRVQKWIQPYAFTPDLVQIKAGEVKTLSLELREKVPPNCREWNINLEFAYVPAKEGREAHKRKSADFRGYVLENQRIAQTRT